LSIPHTVSIDSGGFTDAQLAPAVDALRAGAVIAYPTDTLYGLGGDPRNPAAVEAVFRVKGRAEGQPLPLIAADLRQVESVARLSPLALRMAARFWPGPLTIVLQGMSQLAEGIAASDGTVAIRVPANDVARALARCLGHPVTATSANRSGQPATAQPAVVLSTLGDAIALLVDAGAAPGGPPSTIVDVSAGVPTLVRAGAIAWDRVLESLE
jgi:L-threonylcarbamoyladenylate synthase